MTTGDAIDAFLESKSYIQPAAIKNYARHLEVFRQIFPRKMPVELGEAVGTTITMLAARRDPVYNSVVTLYNFCESELGILPPVILRAYTRSTGQNMGEARRPST